MAQEDLYTKNNRFLLTRNTLALVPAQLPSTFVLAVLSPVVDCPTALAVILIFICFQFSQLHLKSY